MKRDLATRVAVLLVGILIIAGIVMISKVFFRGMLVGVALTFFVMIALYWISRNLRRRK